jgi:outer membrane protein OmpA-like peptidoglycan-associated protein
LKRIAIWGIGAIALALVAASCIRNQVNEQRLAQPQIPAKAQSATQAPAVAAPVAKNETPAALTPSAPSAPVTPLASKPFAAPTVAAPMPVKPTADIATARPSKGKAALGKAISPRKQVASYKAKRVAAYAKKKRVAVLRKPMRKIGTVNRACTAKPGQQIVQSVCFATNSANLSNESKRKLSIAAQKMKATANQRLEIAGFTDGSGNSKINFKLSERRSQAVVNYLVAQGVDRAMLTNKGYGEESAKRAQQHRRVDLKVIQQ